MSIAVLLPPAATSPKKSFFTLGSGPILSRQSPEICGALRVRSSDLISSTLISPILDAVATSEDPFGPPENGWAPMVVILYLKGFGSPCDSKYFTTSSLARSITAIDFSVVAAGTPSCMVILTEI